MFAMAASRLRRACLGGWAWLALWTGCAREAPVAARTGPSAAPPNVILLSLDTLRSDHLSGYGYARPTSPNLDAFAASATRYTRSFATAPWTLPSHASMFTGKFPFEHGAHSFRSDEKTPRNAYPLDLDAVTLTELLKAEGYETAAFVNNIGYLGAWTQLNQGFDLYELNLVYASEFLPSILAWLDQPRTAPFFLFINLMDAHRPYNTTPRPGFIDPPAVHEPRQTKRRLLTQLARAVLPGNPAPPELRQKVIDQYDTAVANLDEQVGRFFQELKRRGLFDPSVILVTSDHGEYFGEHQLVEHSKDLYQAALRVPLIIKAPEQRAGRVIDTPACSADVPGLIVRALPDSLAEKLAPKFPEQPGERDFLAENYYSRTKDLFNRKWGHRFNRVRTALFHWPYKYIRSSDGQNELYDLAADPDELNNLISAEPALTKRLVQRLDEFEAGRKRATERAAGRAPLSESELQALKALGYVDGADEEDEPEQEP